MRRLGFCSFLAGLLLVVAFPSSSLADAKEEAPDFKKYLSWLNLMFQA